MAVKNKILVSFTLVSFFSILFLWVFNIAFLQGDWSVFFEGLTIFGIVVIVLTIFLILTLNRFCHPLNQVDMKLKKKESLNEGEWEALIQTSSKLPRFLYIINSIAFILGPVGNIMAGILIKGRSVHPLYLAVSVIYSVGIGLNASRIEIQISQLYVDALMKRTGRLNFLAKEKKKSISKDMQLQNLFNILTFVALFLVASASYAGRTANVSFPEMEASVRYIYVMADFIKYHFILILVLLSLYLFQSRTALTILKRQLSQILDNFRQLNEGTGGLSEKIVLLENNEVGQLAHHFNVYSANLEQMLGKVESSVFRTDSAHKQLLEAVGGLTEASGTLNRSSDSVNESMQVQNESVEQMGKQTEVLLQSIDKVFTDVSRQAAFVEQSSAAVSEMAANINSVSELAGKAQELTGVLEQHAGGGNESVSQTIEAIREAAEAAGQVAVNINSISRVAAQTNLLAMNAAIEAAHAGESGKGFAVVAAEVRKLAEESRNTAASINDTIKNMMLKIEKSTELSGKTGEAFSLIKQNVAENSRLVGNISAAMEEQNVGTREILDSVNNLVDATQDITELSRKQKAGSEEIKTAYKKLNESTLSIREVLEWQQESRQSILRNTEQITASADNNSQVIEILNEELSRFRQEKQEGKKKAE